MWDFQLYRLGYNPIVDDSLYESLFVHLDLHFSRQPLNSVAMSANKAPHIVVLGAGFGGQTFCQKFRHPDARITLVDRTNHHLFQPQLYQVATAGLSAPEIPSRFAPSCRTTQRDRVAG